MKHLLIISFLSMSISSFANDEETELLCSKALLSEMTKKGLIGGAQSGICIQSLNDLPEVSIGLGSNVYRSGDSSNNSLGGNQERIGAISQILTGSNLDKNNFIIHGYADGENNYIPNYSERFLENKNQFTKEDIRKKISDEPTRKKIFELLSDIDDKTIIEPVKSNPKDKKFIKDPAKNYHPNIERVMSLVNNYYLALERAERTCEQIIGSELTENQKNKCREQSLGHPSPISETDSGGANKCDARRKSVIILNGKPKIEKSSSPSVIQPSFNIPNSLAVKDMQMAASLDLLKKIAESNGSNASSVIEKISSECSGGKTTSSGYEYNKQNLKRMYDDIKSLAEKTSNQELKDSVLMGDYTKVKAITDKIKDQLIENKIPADSPEVKLMNAIISGQDKEATEARIIIADANSEKPLNCEKRTEQEATKDFDRFYTLPEGVKSYKRCIANNAVMYLTGRTWEDTRVERIFMKYPEKKELEKEYYSSFKTIDSKYPKASRSPSNTDVFNCLSASAAIEEKMQSSTLDSSSGDFLEPDGLVADEKGEVKVKIDLPSVSSHKLYNQETPETGWMCKGCHNGMVIKKDPKTNTIGIERRSREAIFKAEGKDSIDKTPLSNMGLTIGSMKNLGYRKITRDSFGDNCPQSMSVCDCFKKAPTLVGGIDPILKKSTVINLKGNGLSIEGKVSLTEKDKKDSCFWAPPVAPSCAVAPSGKSKDSTDKGLTSKSCVALNRFLARYPDRKQIIDSSYNKDQMTYLKSFAGASLKDLQCTKVLVSDDDSVDCPVPANQKKAGSKTGVSSQ